MRRPVRCRWAFLLSLAVFYGLVTLLTLTVEGWDLHPGPLRALLDRLWFALRGFDHPNIATHVIVTLVATLPGVMSLLTYAWLRSGAPASNGYLHCLRCGHILKGLSQPRCPECGEPI